MAVIKINKIEAARRQIDISIRLLFDNEDPIAIHTLSMAGFRILRDIAEKNECNICKSTKSFIKPGMEGKFWGSFNTFANFLKHANKDPEGIFDNFQEGANDSILLMASLYYQDLGYQFTPEMLSLVAWYIAIHPDAISDDFFKKFQTQFKVLPQALIGKSRQEQLVEGKEALNIARIFLQRSTVLST